MELRETGGRKKGMGSTTGRKVAIIGHLTFCEHFVKGSDKTCNKIRFEYFMKN